MAERARRLMDEHGLTQWRFAYDNARRRFGYCRHGVRVIQLSRPLVEANSWEVIRDTVLHEIAHALAGHAAGHGPTWKETAARLGARPDRCYDSDLVTPVEGSWVARCPECGSRSTRHRRPRRRFACSRCCREHAGGRFDERFELVFSQS